MDRVGIDRRFLRTRVARRVVLLFVGCALLPVGVLSVVSFRDVTTQLTHQAETRVRQESKAFGMAIYQQLIALESELLSLNGKVRRFGKIGAADMSEGSRFLSLAVTSPGGQPDVLYGSTQEVLPLSQAHWSILKTGKTLLLTEHHGDEPARVFLVRAVENYLPVPQAFVTEINGEHLWGMAGYAALPEDMKMCVFREPGDTLVCSEGVSSHLKSQWADRVGTEGEPTFDWNDEHESYIAGAWTIPLRFQFSSAAWTIVLSEPRSSVLAPLTRFKYRFSLIVLIAVFCVILLSVNQVRKTMGPLESLGEGTRRVARRDFSAPVRVESGDEFEDLARSFNAMTATLHQQFTQLATIHEIVRSVLSRLDPSHIVDTVLSGLCEVSACEGVAVLLLDPSDSERGWLYARAGKDRTGTTMEGVGVSESEHGRLMQCSDYLLLPTASEFSALTPLCTREDQWLLVLPLFRSKDLLGAIALASSRSQQVHEETSLQLRQLADQVAVALSNALDLSERKRAEVSLQESNAQLTSALQELQSTQAQMVQQERLRALGQMASGIAHDFNNTLSPIVGFSELLLIDPHGLENHELVKEYLQTINLAAKDAAKVVSRLRDFYRPRLDADLVGFVDVNRLMEQIVTLSQPKWKDQALANGIAIDLRVEMDVVQPVVGHESELREVLTNLVFNAVDAMPNSGVITLRSIADGEYVRLEVSDSGTGMSEEVRRRCLEPFFSTKGEKGTGLGLAMAYGIIRRLRGTIDITSELGKGTTFSIRLPIQSNLQEGRHAEEPHVGGMSLEVLVVDDDALVGRVTCEYLRVAGHRVTFAGSAGEAIRMFHPERVQVVVTDHGMPHMTGRQLAQVIRNISPETVVILLTGGGEMDDEQTQSDAVTTVLSKPLTMASLQIALSQITIRKGPRTDNMKEIGDAA